MTNICGCASIVLIFIILPIHCIIGGDSSQTKHLQFPIGSIKQLHCRLTPPSVKRVIWERKPCKEEYFNRRKCKDDGNWTLLAETSRKLTLGKTNESLNGLYRCKHNNKVVREFYVEIAGTASSLNPPKIESLTWSASVNPPLIEYTFLCNISSEVEPAVLWVKQCHGSTCLLNYENKCFCPMNNATKDQLFNIDNTYLSKIKLSNVREVDSGWYGCVAVTESGKDFKNVTIKVNPVRVANLSPYTLLFLIPLAFILTPAAIWLCYYWNRKKSRTKCPKEQLIQPISTRT